jgi:hypothetical protein
MSDRHMHITSFLHETQERVDAFIQAARELPGAFFWFVSPVVNDHGRTIAVALFSKDMDGISDEMEMPQVAEALSGILEYDIEIVSAWEGGDAPGRRSTPRERVWVVRGASSRKPLHGEIVQREIEA